MNQKKKVLLVGWYPHSPAINYHKIPAFTAEKLVAMLEADRQKLIELGLDAELCYIHSGDTAYDEMAAFLEKHHADIISIGAGVRLPPEHLLVFEKLVNAVHALAPQAKICFNTNPSDTAEAVQRWA